MADPTQPPPGLINTTPGSTNTTPGTPPTGAPGSGAPVTGYNPSSATAGTAGATGYTPNAYGVKPNQTVAGQIKNIIAAGSPLMTQAEANAKNLMNQRGLINSSQAITADQSALYSAATPIATADAATYDRAATNTTNAQNTELASTAAATNTAGLQNAAGQTSTSQFNSGQTNAALASEASASNTVGLTSQQGANAIALQEKQNEGNLANIRANGVINEQITKLTNDNKTLLQTSQGAANIYSQALQNLSAITTNPNLSTEQKTNALNNGVMQLNDALAVLGQIAQIPDLQSLLNFTNGS